LSQHFENNIFLSFGFMSNPYGRGWVTIDKALRQADSRRRSGSGTAATGDMSRTKQVNLTEAQHKALQNTATKYNNLKDVHKDLQAQHGQLQIQVNQLQTQVNTLNNAAAAHNEELQAKDEEITNLTKQVEEQAAEIETLKEELGAANEAIRATGAVDETKLNSELVLHTENATKAALFRSWKFLENEEDVVLATKAVIPFLSVGIEMPEQEYLTNYKGIVRRGLQKGRQYVQSEGKKRAQGKQ
jgi:hypothetical protein